MTLDPLPSPVFFHVALHEAGHVVALKAVLGEPPPALAVDLRQPEPRGWSEVFEALMAREPRPDPTRVTAFLLGGVEALIHGAETGFSGANRFHGLNGPDGSGCDAELIDVAVMSYGADRWRASDMARAAITRDWRIVVQLARTVAAASRIDPVELAPLLAQVAPV